VNNPPQIAIYGEVLFDCFDEGAAVLGGAPFNVAWHLAALGDEPLFISRVGLDVLGETVMSAMREWGMSLQGIQTDEVYPTGQVNVAVVDDEPQYTILPDQAYDYVDISALEGGIPPLLYHGTLALRSEQAKAQFNQFVKAHNPAVFLDINLRAPWWQQDEVFDWLAQAKWVKLNEHELRILGYQQANIDEAMKAFKADFSLAQLVLTMGEKGAKVLCEQGDFHSVTPTPAAHFEDTVGAGDAFTAVYLHGLINNWNVDETIAAAQSFASQIVGIRGATSQDKSLYANLR
jgi:fructokinase